MSKIHSKRYKELNLKPIVVSFSVAMKLIAFSVLLLFLSTLTGCGMLGNSSKKEDNRQTYISVNGANKRLYKNPNHNQKYTVSPPQHAIELPTQQSGDANVLTIKGSDIGLPQASFTASIRYFKE